MSQSPVILWRASKEALKRYERHQEHQQRCQVKVFELEKKDEQPGPEKRTAFKVQCSPRKSHMPTRLEFIFLLVYIDCYA